VSISRGPAGMEIPLSILKTYPRAGDPGAGFLIPANRRTGNGIDKVFKAVIIHIGQWRYRMKAMVYFTSLCLTMSLISCSTGGISSNDGEAAAVSAPAALTGKKYRVTAESGSGVFPSKGTFTVVFLNSQSWYTVKGDGANFPDSWGMYSYSSSGAGGIVNADDSVGSQFVFSFTFNTAISGAFVATSTADLNSRLSGTFTE